ncbi:proline reductase [Clostridia bacterium]|nr:proline reductase [Clostridia bacterium]
MKIIMIYDQIQSGLGSKDDTLIPLTGKKESIGPAVMMEPFLKQAGGQVVACLCCGNGTYLADPEEISRKFCAMVNKLQPDVVMCGPAFNYKDYAQMCAKVACDINATSKAKAFAAMSAENEDTIAAYQNKVAIVKTPKKGGMGLNDSLKNMCALARALADGADTATLMSKFCY